MNDIDQLPADQQTLYYTKKMYHDMHFFFKVQKMRFIIKTAFTVIIIAGIAFGGWKTYQMIQNILNSKVVQSIQSLSNSADSLKESVQEVKDIKKKSTDKVENFIDKYIKN